MAADANKRRAISVIESGSRANKRRAEYVTREEGEVFCHLLRAGLLLRAAEIGDMSATFFFLSSHSRKCMCVFYHY